MRMRIKLETKPFKRGVIVYFIEEILSSARFGWYDNMLEDPFMTLYAYMADMYATEALNVDFDKETVARIQTSYRGAAYNNVLKESLMMWMGAQMQQPVQGLLLPMLKDIEAKEIKVRETAKPTEINNYLMSPIHFKIHYKLAKILIGLAAKKSIENKFNFNKGELLAIQKVVETTAKEVIKGPGVLPAIAAATYLQQKNEGIEVYLNRLDYEHSTIDRALAIVLSSQQIDSKDAAVAKKLSGKDWKVIAGKSLNQRLLYVGKPVKQSVVQAEAKLDIVHLYSSYSPDTHHPEVEIKSKVFQFIEGKELQLEAVKDPRNLEAAKIYFLKVDITSKQGKSYGILEVALPPGGQVEKGLAGSDVVIGNEKLTCASSFDETNLAIGIPVKNLSDNTTVLIPLRFSAKGDFILPRTRFYQMYNEENKSYEGKNEPNTVNVKIN